jgi:hypothetical protein
MRVVFIEKAWIARESTGGMASTGSAQETSRLVKIAAASRSYKTRGQRPLPRVVERADEGVDPTLAFDPPAWRG